MTGLTVEAEDGATQVFGYSVSDLQTSIAVSGEAITGTLKFIDSGSLADVWGEGNFIALKFSDFSSGLTYEDVKVGLYPSEGSGLVTLDSDCNGVFKVTDKNVQKIMTVQTGEDGTFTQYYTLSGLTVETE